MASYVVMEPPVRGSDDAVVVRDGFYFLAFIVPLLWLLVHRLWIEALAVLAVTLSVAAAGSYVLAGPAGSIAALALNLFIGLEASSLRLAALRRRGWRDWGVVEAENRDDAEIRYLLRAEATGDLRRDTGNLHDRGATPTRRDETISGPALGMLAYPTKG